MKLRIVKCITRLSIYFRMKQIFFNTFICFLFSVFLFPHSILAYQQNLPNNKFGIHLAQPHEADMKRAADLVNGSGGDWGYVTVVMQENDRNTEKWQQVFDKMRDYHLIPLVRLATEPEGSKWRRPSEDDVDQWVTFLNSLNWVVKDRFVILFNEPNHGTEWGGYVDAIQYAHVAQAFGEKLKASNKDYFLMIAGLDASAPSQVPYYGDEADFLRQVVQTIGSEKFNNLFNGVSSHSYPNPAFMGSADGNGRGSIRTYMWEKSLLSSYGVKDLPVFITETGWDGQRIGRDTVASYFEHAYLYVWLPDKQVVAVTPFVLNYQGDPFLPFSWVTQGEGDVYPQYQRIRSLPKQVGKPEIIQKGEIRTDLPSQLVEQSHYSFQFTLSNSGQGYWDDTHGYRLQVKGLQPDQYYVTGLDTVRTGGKKEIGLFINTQTMKGDYNASIQLLNGDDVVVEYPWKFSIVTFPSLTLKLNLYPKLSADGDDYDVQIFDNTEKMVFEKDGLSSNANSIYIDKVTNIAPGVQYRIVVRRVPYLPRQTILKFQTGNNIFTMKRMYPLDFNGDGAFTFIDIWAFIRHPGLISFFFP